MIKCSIRQSIVLLSWEILVAQLVDYLNFHLVGECSISHLAISSPFPLPLPPVSIYFFFEKKCPLVLSVSSIHVEMLLCCNYRWYNVLYQLNASI